jgi:sporulation protein YabP
MDKAENSFNHSITLNERKNIIISGVTKIESFDNEEFLLSTTMGFLMIKGEGLEIIKLDTLQGTVSLKGKLNLLNYIEDVKTRGKEDGVFNNKNKIVDLYNYTVIFFPSVTITIKNNSYIFAYMINHIFLYFFNHILFSLPWIANIHCSFGN